MSSATSTTRISMRSIAAVIGFLAFAEFTSGIIQGYYTPLYHDIAIFLGVNDPELNWLEAAQLSTSAIAVPAFAKLGDLIGHRRMLLIFTGITAAASLTLAFSGVFWLFLIAGAVQGIYVVWLPLEIAIVFTRSQVTARLPGSRFDTGGLVLVALALVGVTGGLSLLRLNGPGSALPWVAPAVGASLFVPSSLYELRQAEPLVNVRLFRSSSLWPVFVTAGVFGVSVLSTQVPLSTFARTHAVKYGTVSAHPQV